MKNLKIYLAIISLTFLINACDSDIIDLSERDRLPSDIAVASLQGLETSMLAVYERADLCLRLWNYPLQTMCDRFCTLWN